MFRLSSRQVRQQCSIKRKCHSPNASIQFAGLLASSPPSSILSKASPSPPPLFPIFASCAALHSIKDRAKTSTSSRRVRGEMKGARERPTCLWVGWPPRESRNDIVNVRGASLPKSVVQICRNQISCLFQIHIFKIREAS